MGGPGTALPGEDYEANGVLRLSLRTVSKVEPPSKWLLINLIAAWKTASRQAGGVGGFFFKEILGHQNTNRLFKSLFCHSPKIF